jgi:hypothetical protein
MAYLVAALSAISIVSASQDSYPGISEKIYGSEAPKFQQYSSLGSKSIKLWLSDASAEKGRAIRVTKETYFREGCVDEFLGLQAFDDYNIQNALELAKYEFCSVPEAPVKIGEYKIEPKLKCPDETPDDGETGNAAAAKWIRLDCKFTHSGSDEEPFYASRLGHKRSYVMQLNGPSKLTLMAYNFFGETPSQEYFRNRVMCDEGHKNIEAQMKECAGLLRSWINIENAFTRMAEAKITKNSDLARPEEEPTDLQADNQATDKQDGGMSTTTILLIAGGAVAVLAIGFGAWYMMSSTKGSKVSRKSTENGQLSRQNARSKTARESQRSSALPSKPSQSSN